MASSEEAEKLINQGGWVYAGALPTGKVVLQKRGIRARTGTGPEGFEPTVSEARLFSSEG